MEPNLDFSSLSQYFKTGVNPPYIPDQSISIDSVLERARKYLIQIREISRSKLIDKTTAEAILVRLEKFSILAKENPEKWKLKTILLGMYFVQIDDKDNDLDSPMGFDDDAELFNILITKENLKIEKIPLN